MGSLRNVPPLLSLIFSLFATAAISQIAPPGQCAVIVASRSNMTEVGAFMAENSHLSFEGVYTSQNGWLAISLGTIDIATSDATIALMVGQGLVPPDTLCSTGRAYIRRVWSPAPESVGAGVAASLSLFAPFDARPLTVREKRFLQAGLTLAGYYNGLLDGAWGSGTQTAFEQYALAELGLSDNNGAATILALTTLNWIEENGWQAVYYSSLGALLQIPTYHFTDTVTADGFVQLRSSRSPVWAILSFSNALDTGRLHDAAASENTGQIEPYYLRRNDRVVTSVSTATGQVYVRSDWVDDWQVWINFLIRFPRVGSDGTAEMMIASYRIGQGDGLNLPAGSHLERVVASAIAETERTEERVEPTPPPPNQVASVVPDATEAEPEGGSSGTGFFINADGNVMTNWHVVDGCRQIRVDGFPAVVVAESDSFDLAILGLEEEKSVDSFLSFSDAPARLNSDITVAGFPLYPLLGGLNITRGAVSAVEGLGGDSARMHITAPVQPGNSGGPIVDQSGRVVGIVVSKLDAGFLLEATGDIPQNINFGIRGQIGKMFAEMNLVDTTSVEMPEQIGPEDLAERLSQATVLIECD